MPSINSLLLTNDDVFTGVVSFSVWRRPLSELIITGLDNPYSPETQCTLSQNSPNPFTQTTTIRYFLPKESFVKLTVSDIDGREIETLVNTVQSKGTHEITLNAVNYLAGVYFYKLVTGSHSKTRKMIAN
jgi:hypothetical protein